MSIHILPTRHEAEQAYKLAKTAWNKATQGNNPDEFISADKALAFARSQLLAAELAFPTSQEILTQRNQIRRRLTAKG